MGTPNKSVRWYTVHEAVEKFRGAGHPEVNSRRVALWAKTGRISSERRKQIGEKVSTLYINAADVDRHCKAGTVPGNASGNIRMSYTDEFIDDLADKLVEWFQTDVEGANGSKRKRFLLLEFAEENGLHEQRFQEFCDRSQKFSEAYKFARTMQESRIVRLGFATKNPMFPMFFLNSIHGYKQRSETTGKIEVTERKLYRVGDTEFEL